MTHLWCNGSFQFSTRSSRLEVSPGVYTEDEEILLMEMLLTSSRNAAKTRTN